MILRVAGAVLLLLSAAMVALGQTPTSNPSEQTPEVETVRYCELMSNPEYYFDKVMRVEAVLTNLITNESILRSGCGGVNYSMSVGFVKDKFDELWEQIRPKMYSWRARDAKVIVVGKFHGPRSPDSGYNYGHMGWSKYRFEITSLEKIERMPKEEE